MTNWIELLKSSGNIRCCEIHKGDNICWVKLDVSRLKGIDGNNIRVRIGPVEGGRFANAWLEEDGQGIVLEVVI